MNISAEGRALINLLCDVTSCIMILLIYIAVCYLDITFCIYVVLRVYAPCSQIHHTTLILTKTLVLFFTLT